MPSSVIRKFDYHGEQRRLDVEFVSGRAYSFHDVPEEAFAEMRAAFSKGRYFNRMIRDRYRFTRLY